MFFSHCLGSKVSPIFATRVFVPDQEHTVPGRLSKPCAPPTSWERKFVLQSCENRNILLDRKIKQRKYKALWYWAMTFAIIFIGWCGSLPVWLLIIETLAYLALHSLALRYILFFDYVIIWSWTIVVHSKSKIISFSFLCCPVPQRREK